MGRTRKIENGGIWWAIERKTRKRVSQKDEKCTKCSISTRRLQTSIHKKTQGRITRRGANQKTSRRRAWAGKIAWAGLKEKGSTDSWGFQKSKRRTLDIANWDRSQRKRRRKENLGIWKKTWSFGTFKKNKRGREIQTKVRRQTDNDRQINSRIDESTRSIGRNFE